MTQTDKQDDKQDKPEPRLQRAKTWVVESWMGLLILSAVIVVIASAFLLPFLWRQAGSATWDGNATRNIALVIGGLIAIYGVVIAARRQATNQRQYELALKSDFSETFAKGVSALASDIMTIKISGIRVFDNLAKSIEANSSDYGMIVETINDFIIESAAPPIDERTGKTFAYADLSEWPKPKPRGQRQHIKVATRVLGELANEMGDAQHEIELAYLDLRELVLNGVSLKGANLGGTGLSGTSLVDTKLAGVRLINAKMLGVRLSDADLTGAKFNGAIMYSAELMGCDLNGSSFIGTKMGGSYVTSATLFSVKTNDVSKQELKTADTETLREMLGHAKF